MTSNQWLALAFFAMFLLYWIIMGFVSLFLMTQSDENPSLKDLAIYFGLGGAIVPALLIYKVMTGKTV